MSDKFSCIGNYALTIVMWLIVLEIWDSLIVCLKVFVHGVLESNETEQDELN